MTWLGRIHRSSFRDKLPTPRITASLSEIKGSKRRRIKLLGHIILAFKSTVIVTLGIKLMRTLEVRYLLVFNSLAFLLITTMHLMFIVLNGVSGLALDFLLELGLDRALFFALF